MEEKKEIKKIEQPKEVEEKIEPVKEKKVGRLERMEQQLEELQGKKKKQPKKFRLPGKAKVNPKRMREGYCTVVIMEDNHNINFVKEPIIDGTIKLKNTFHVVGEEEVYFYKNKPLIFQPKRLLNPYNPLKQKHETYGHQYFMVRMLADKIVARKKMSLGIGIGLLVIVGIVIYAVLGG